ncbi:hypothetical protein DAI21_22660 (plasmid) [Lelliottia sp. WB101]|uniref:hypothetical protein n=1 Tax=Lelliottia sp. WB101 TaxID=2153385 RepID=UPI000D2265C7|nr:hypothetical protein [Lelliottia sp. WB101]AVZ00425.1 hypothetical protein DAI21_22660 [Lelliottia sp. WB101]
MDSKDDYTKDKIISEEKSNNQSNDYDDLKNCESELDVLKQVDPAKYADLHARFTQMMKGAADYSHVRGSVNTATQGAIDSLYRFSTISICSDIRAETLKGLSNKPGV